MRQEVRRFVYLCDGMQTDNGRCSSVQVIDACTEREADSMAIKNGWKLSPRGCLCNAQKHVGLMDKSVRRTAGL